MLNFRECSTWQAILRIQTVIAVLIILLWGAVYLHKGWQSVWRREAAVVTKQPSFSVIDPALAKDPSVQAAKIKVVGPLANKLQPSETDTETGSTDSNPLDPNSYEMNVSAARSRPSTGNPSNVDLVTGFHRMGPVHLFHGRILVQGYRDLQFEIPPHASLPRISGTYKNLSNVQARRSGVLLLSEQQFREFLRGGPSDAVLASEGLSGTIDVALSPTHLQSQKYHLLIRNSSAQRTPVQADFTISFE